MLKYILFKININKFILLRCIYLKDFYAQARLLLKLLLQNVFGKILFEIHFGHRRTFRIVNSMVMGT